MEPIRLQKFFTDCKIMSRRAAEAEIAAGKVYVNGKPAKIGDKVDPDGDIVVYSGKTILYSHNQHTYILLHKPRGYLTSMCDDRGRKCVTELVSDLGTRVYPVGRLDLNSEGLLLLTDDGELTNMLTHPKHHVPKIYQVSVHGELSDETLEQLQAPMLLDGYRTHGATVELLERHRGSGKLKITLFEGRNRQIRKMCEQAGLAVGRLCRIQIGDIGLRGLALGKWRFLDRDEIRYLQNLKKDWK